MQNRDNRHENSNPATIVTGLGKLWEKGLRPSDSFHKIAFGEFQLHPAGRRLLREGKPVLLRNRPFQVLLYLVTHRDRMVEQSELLAVIWGSSDVYHDALRKAVGGIRVALGDDSQQPRFIETHWGKGYRFIGEVVEEWPEIANTVLVKDELQTGLPVERRRSSAHTARDGFRRFTVGIAAAFVLIAALFAIRKDGAAHGMKAAPEAQVLSGAVRRPVNENERAAYFEAQYLLSQRSSESIPRAMDIFSQIIKANPRAGDAFAGLAECYGLGYWGFWKIDEAVAVEKSAEYARAAVDAEPGSGYAHAQLAAAYLRQLKIRDAQAEFEQALAIRPDDAEVHHAYAIFLDDTHRADGGIQEMKRAIDLQPLSLAYKTDLGMSYFFAHRYDDAVAQYKSVLKLDPGYLEAHEYLASMYVYQAQWTQARAEYALIDGLRGKGAKDSSSSPLRLITEFKIGERDKAQARVADLRRSPSINNFYSLARIYAQLGMSEDALQYLSRVVNSQSPELFFIPDDPTLTPLHGNEHFEALVRKVSEIFAISGEQRSVQAAAVVLPVISTQR